jgi:hypothetical protein
LINESVARDFQDKYIEGQRGAMAGLYAECRHISELLVFAYAKSHKVSFGPAQVDEYSHDAASRLLTRYTKYPGYFVRSFGHMLRQEVRNVLTEGGRQTKRIRFRRDMVPLECAAGTEAGKQSPQPEPFNRLLDHKEGQQIILDIVKARSYRGAVLQVGGYVSHDWMRARAVELAYVYRMTRKRQ